MMLKMQFSLSVSNPQCPQSHRTNSGSTTLTSRSRGRIHPIIHPELDKITAVALPESHKRIILQLRLHSKLVRRRAPPTRLELEDEHVRVVEEPALFRHSAAVEPAKHVPVCRESDERDVRFSLDIVEQPFMGELVNSAVEDDRLDLAFPVHSLGALMGSFKVGSSTFVSVP